MKRLTGWLRYRRYLRALVASTYRRGATVPPGTYARLKAEARVAADRARGHTEA
jgi:hypothetical protein